MKKGLPMISKKLRAAIKLDPDHRAYEIAHKAGIDPSTLSKLICGIVKVNPGDERVIKVGKVLGLSPDECFQEEPQ
jgi:transcriptional regulator with XRE-family HTH domain